MSDQLEKDDALFRRASVSQTLRRRTTRTAEREKVLPLTLRRSSRINHIAVFVSTPRARRRVSVSQPRAVGRDGSLDVCLFG